MPSNRIAITVEKRLRPAQVYFPTAHDRIEWNRSSVATVNTATPSKIRRRRWPTTPYILAVIFAFAGFVWSLARHFGWLP